MSLLGNILWFLLGGAVEGLGWFLLGCVWSITIIGIPIGRQCFKFAKLSFFPFGKDVDYGGGSFSFIANVIWLIFLGLPMALVNLFWGCLLCVTIIGIPFGKQFIKMAKLSLMPFGTSVE